MKLISKIVKQEAGSRLGLCVDGESVSLSTWMTDNDVKTAVRLSGRHPNNIWKVKVANRFMPLGHPKGDYTAYEGTSVIFG